MPTSNEPDNRPFKKGISQAELPLEGQTVLVTRARDQAGSLCERLEALGARTVVYPVIQILPMADADPINDVLSRFASFDWIVFVSANGVHFFLDRLHKSEGLIESLRQKKIATIGSSTQSKLNETAGIEAGLIPNHSNSESLADALVEAARDQRVLLVRASRGSQELPRRLGQAGIDFEELSVYQSVDVTLADPVVAQQLQARQIDWVTMTSSAIASSTIRLFGESLRNTRTVSISPTTSAAMIELGLEPDAEASSCNMDGIVEAILKHVRRG